MSGMNKELQDRFELLRREIESVRQYLGHLEDIALDIQKFATKDTPEEVAVREAGSGE